MRLFFPRRPALPGWVGWLWGKEDQSWLGLPPSSGSSGVMICTAGVRRESKRGWEEMSYWGRGATFRLEAEKIWSRRPLGEQSVAGRQPGVKQIPT